MYRKTPYLPYLPPNPSGGPGGQPCGGSSAAVIYYYYYYYHLLPHYTHIIHHLHLLSRARVEQS